MHVVSLLLASAVVAQSSLDELQRSLVLADLEQLDHSLLVRRKTSDFANEIANEFGVFVLLLEEKINKNVDLRFIRLFVGFKKKS